MIPVLYDKTGVNKIGDLIDSIECYVEEERNGIFELTMIYPANTTLLDNLCYENIIVVDANDYLKNQKFRIYNTRKLMSNRIEICARHISFDLAHDWIDALSINNQSCEYALNMIFKKSQFSSHFKGYSDIINAQNYAINETTCLNAIGGSEGSILDTFGTGAEILRDNTDIHVLNHRGSDNDVSIEYRKNLTGLEVEEDTTDLITRILPYATYTGDNGEEIKVKGGFVDSPLINNYAHPYIKYIDYSEDFDEGNLPTTSKLETLATKEYTNNKVDIPKLNYKIEFIPLSKCAGYEGLEDRINLCDTVTIRDTRYSIDTQSKVIKATYDVLRNRYESMELGEPRTTLGDVIGGTGEAIQGPPGPQGPQGPAGADGSIGDFPSTLPQTPTITTKVYGFANIELSWTFENKVYYSYELYASKTKGFTPNTFNLIFSGQASTFLHQVNPNETWYYRVCALNTHGLRTDFSKEVKVSTVKISDLSNYVESAAIGDALIGELNLGRGWVGELKGNYIDAKQLSVTDGNGKRTLDIDSFGNINLDVTTLKIKSESAATQTLVEKTKNEAISSANSTLATTIKDYYTKSQTNTAIKTAKDEINLDVSSTYETRTNVTTKVNTALSDAKTYANTKKTEAINSANSTLTETLKSYSTTSQMNSAISVAKDSITQSVSSAYATKESLNTANTNITNLTTRVSSAESKLTKNSLTTTIGDHYTTANKVNDLINDKGYATTSSVTQTVNALEIAFTESGGYNLIENSTGYNYNIAGWANTNNNNKLIKANKSSSTKLQTGHYLRMDRDSDTGTNATWAVSRRFRLKPNTTYTFSGWVMSSTSSKGIGVTVRTSNTINESSEDRETYNKTYSGYSGQTSGIWESFSKQFTTDSDVLSGFVVASHNGYSSDTGSTNRVYWSELMLTEGSLTHPWSPHPNEVYGGITTIDRDGITVTHTNSDMSSTISADGFKIKNDSTNKEVFNATNGNLTMEGVLSTGTSGKHIKVSDSNYKMYNGSTQVGFLGLASDDNYTDAPKLYLGNKGVGVSSGNDYFSINHYKANDNPQSYSSAYADLSYYNANRKDFSNIKMYGDGNIRIAPIKALEITTNYVDGEYVDGAENRLAYFLASSSSWYNSSLQIGAIVNQTNTNGLILRDNRDDNGDAAVRVHCDSSGNKFFRPLWSGTHELGSSSYYWSKSFVANSYSNNGVILSDVATLSETEITADNAIDHINFITPTTRDVSAELLIDVTTLKDTNFVEVSEDAQTAFINDNEMIKLLLFEVKKLKEEIRQLKVGSN